MANDKKLSFEENEKQQLLSIRDNTTPFERLKWLDDNLSLFKDAILKNKEKDDLILPKILDEREKE